MDLAACFVGSILRNRSLFDIHLKYILENIKPYLTEKSIILFDELYNMEGWRVGEFKALTEEFKKKEYKYLAFSSDREQVVIQYKSK